ncbi:helix-hairpin-helix domain-containing protein [Aestuariimicrobium ganziense]|uniref:helix-hairpin-helix domain-containing protein n=1 Tax=Aestuariimicrobium ganziense TaxID=2773677 RepID=UPI0019413179|nr:helix-hairpin-helix domain-containing protein [Aestuariimicrobium ganziense]
MTGQVRKPGVVRLPTGARVHDAVTAAGGTTGQADLGSLNLAAVVTDGSQVVVGRRGGPSSVVSQAPDADAGGPAGQPGSGKLNINTATVAQLEELPGVGPVTAASIVSWREQHGRFTRIEELQEVDGIGPKTYARLAEHVTV